MGQETAARGGANALRAARATSPPGRPTVEAPAPCDAVEAAAGYHLRIFGAFGVTDAGNRPLHIGRAKECALIAVLCLSPGFRRSRSWLRALLWSGHDDRRAAANLRQAIWQIRETFAGGPPLIDSDGTVVWLNADAILSVNHPDRGQLELLEGIDIRDEAFEDWLRTMRNDDIGTPDVGDATQDPRPDRRTGRNGAVAPAGPAGLSQGGRVALGLLPTAHAGLTPAELLEADSVCDAIARLVSQMTGVAVHDLRGVEEPVVPLPLEDGTGATHLVQAIVERRADRLHLRLRLTDGISRRLLWLSEPVDAATAWDSELAASATDALLDRLRASATTADAPDLFPYTALVALFSLDDDLIARTEAQIERMIDAGGPPVLQCLRAFTQVFRANESLGHAAPVDADGLCSVIADIPLSDPMLPLCESLAGYAAHMLLGRNDMAEALLDSAFLRAPHLPLNLDHLAVLRLARGDVAGADAAFRLCLRAGAFSPWRYTYEVTGAMIAIARGDARDALLFANRAIMRKPRFLGALRYAMVGFAVAGNAADARRMQARIMALRPGHDLPAWTESLLRRTPRELGHRLTASLKTHELI